MGFTGKPRPLGSVLTEKPARVREQRIEIKTIFSKNFDEPP